jgi:hypothetical protein
MVARHGEHRRTEREQETVGPLVLLTAAAIRQITRCDDQLGASPHDQLGQRSLDLQVLSCTRVKIGNMQDVYAHGRKRL